MILLAFLDFVLIALVLLTVVTQIILPVTFGTALFPFFRRRRKLEQQLTEAREEVVEAKLEREVAQITKRADALRRSQASHTGSGERAGEQKEERI